MSTSLGERRRHVEELVAQGELPAWKGALLLEWLATPAASAGPGPSPEQLALLLLDGTVLARLRRVPGPWDVLYAQASSHASHRGVGEGLAKLDEARAGDPSTK